MTQLLIAGVVLVVILAITGLFHVTRHRRPMWGVCVHCDVRTIYINGVNKWLHVRGDEDPDGDGHAAVPRPASVHLRAR